MSGENDNASREDIHSKAVRAGKRTYFFDVKGQTRHILSQDYRLGTKFIKLKIEKKQRKV